MTITLSNASDYRNNELYQIMLHTELFTVPSYFKRSLNLLEATYLRFLYTELQ